MDFVALFLFFSLHIFYFVVAAKWNFLLIIRENWSFKQCTSEQSLKEETQWNYLVWCYMQGHCFSVFFSWVFGQYRSASRVYHNLKGKEYQETDLWFQAIWSDANFHIRGQISLVRGFGPMENFLGCTITDHGNGRISSYTQSVNEGDKSAENVPITDNCTQ